MRARLFVRLCLFVCCMFVLYVCAHACVLCLLLRPACIPGDPPHPPLPRSHEPDSPLHALLRPSCRTGAAPATAAAPLTPPLPASLSSAAAPVALSSPADPAVASGTGGHDGAGAAGAGAGAGAGADGVGSAVAGSGGRPAPDAQPSAAYVGVEAAVQQLEAALQAAKPKGGQWEIGVLVALRQHMLAGVSASVRGVTCRDLVWVLLCAGLSCASRCTAGSGCMRCRDSPLPFFMRCAGGPAGPALEDGRKQI